MLVRAIQLGIEQDNIKELNDLFIISNDEQIAKYLKYNDNTFLSEFSNEKYHGKCQGLISKLLKRNLFKQVYKASISSNLILPEAVDKISRITEKENIDLRKRIECEISKILHSITKQYILPENVIVNCYTIKSYYNESIGKEGPIYIKKEDEDPKYFHEESKVITPIEKELNETLVEVYSPLYYTDALEKKSIVNAIRPIITEFINSIR